MSNGSLKNAFKVAKYIYKTNKHHLPSLDVIENFVFMARIYTNPLSIESFYIGTMIINKYKLI